MIARVRWRFQRVDRGLGVWAAMSSTIGRCIVKDLLIGEWWGGGGPKWERVVERHFACYQTEDRCKCLPRPCIWWTYWRCLLDTTIIVQGGQLQMQRQMEGGNEIRDEHLIMGTSISIELFYRIKKILRRWAQYLSSIARTKLHSPILRWDSWIMQIHKNVKRGVKAYRLQTFPLWIGSCFLVEAKRPDGSSLSSRQTTSKLHRERNECTTICSGSES